MRKMSVLIGAAAAALIVALPATATATAPLDVTIEVDTSIELGGGPFVATGPAVDDGLFCASGDTFDVAGKVAGGTPQGVNFQVFKLFVCDDGSGAAVIKLQVRIDRKGDNFNWNVVDGSGAYEDLHGTGGGIGIPTGPTSVFDIFSGGMHID